jgi:hypothetical protein
MPDPTSVKEIDLTPIPGKKYFDNEREWREEFIYFLMVDRFQDDTPRPIVTHASRSSGITTPNTFFGSNIKGISRNLDYLAGLGCTAIWLSPVFENNDHAYHGYDINNYLRIDPHFGTKQARPYRFSRRRAQFRAERPSISHPYHSRCRHQSFGRQLVLPGRSPVLLVQRSDFSLWGFPPG